MTAARAREQSQSLCLGSSLRLGLVPVGLTVEDRAGRNATSLLPPGETRNKHLGWFGGEGLLCVPRTSRRPAGVNLTRCWPKSALVAVRCCYRWWTRHGWVLRPPGGSFEICATRAAAEHPLTSS